MNGSRSGKLNRDLRREAQYRIVVTVLEILHEAWPETAADSRVTRTSHEDAISNVLRWNMAAAKECRKPVPALHFERESQSDDPMLATKTGLIDIKVLYTWNDETYLTMECKRVSSKGNSLALAYVRQGINRFVTCKYSPGHAFGIMVGYSICGNLAGCASRVCKTLAKESATVTGFDVTVGWKVDSAIIQGTTHYRTSHRQDAVRNQIELLHVLLPLN